MGAHGTGGRCTRIGDWMISIDRPISKRATTILQRFPRHLDLTREDKLFARIVNGLARELDVKTMQLGRVRKSHRLGQADEIRDLLRLAALHDLKPIRFDLVRLRHDVLMDLAGIMTAEGVDPSIQEETAAAVQALLGVVNLGPYSSDYTALSQALLDMTGYQSCLSITRHQVQELIRIHRAGNGSVRSLLEACAAYLHLRVSHIAHVGDDYWHIAHCKDRMALPSKDRIDSGPAADDDWLALEENPMKKTTIDPGGFVHGGKRKIVRNGFDPVPVTVFVTGIEDRTCFPMIVDTGKGHGLYYAGIVADQQTLAFTADGRVLLDGEPADNNAFSFTGAVFAEETEVTEAAPLEFAFCNEYGTTPYGQCGVFVETTPVKTGFSAEMPHTGGLSPAVILAVGATNLQFFVRTGHWGTRVTTPSAGDLSAVESYSAGHFDSSVYALDETGAGAEEPAALLGFEWQEREAFKAVVWLPSRFEGYDRQKAEDELSLADRLVYLLDRHRAAGISLEVRYASDLWELPKGYVTHMDSPESYKSITAGSRLWNTGSPQPETG